jgi:hypothetical protein
MGAGLTTSPVKYLGEPRAFAMSCDSSDLPLEELDEPQSQRDRGSKLQEILQMMEVTEQGMAITPIVIIAAL